jgi:hypothetical protein
MAEEVNDAVLLAYEELYDGCEDIEAHSDLVRSIGFRIWPETASEFVSSFVTNRTGA